MTGRLTTMLVVFALITGVILTGWGLAHLQWPQALPWSSGGLQRYVIFIIVCTVLVIGGSYWSKRSPLLVGASIAFFFALLAGALWSLLVTLWFAVASAIFGRSILALLRIRTDEDNWLISFLVGAGIYGTAVGLLAHFPVNYPGVYGAALTSPLVLGWRVVAEQGKSFLGWSARKVSAGFNIHKLDVAIAVVALVYFVVALMPEVGHDALAMHMFIPAHLLLRHQWGFDSSTYVWAVMPMLGDWIFSIGYMLAGETAARLINVGFIFILGWLVRDLVLWAGGSVAGARWAALIFLSTPLTFTEGSSLFIESVWAAFVVAGTLMILISCSTSGEPKLELPIAGLLLGCALASKAVTFTLLPVLLLLLILRHRSWYKKVGLPLLALGFCLFLIFGLVPYATAWWLTGNPVFPFFNGIFKSPYFPAINFESSSIYGQGLTWNLLYRATFESEKYLEAIAGASGFQWLLLFLPATIALILTRHRKGIGLLLAGELIVAFVFHSVSYFRYAFPAWAILAAAIGVALSQAYTESAFIKNLWFTATGATLLLNLLFINAGAQYADFELLSIGTDSSREDYLQTRLPIRNAIELVKRMNTGRAPVAVFSQPLTAGLLADAFYPNWYNQTFKNEIIAARTEQAMANTLQWRGVDFVILDSNWNGDNDLNGAAIRAQIEKITEKVADSGSISIRKIKAGYQFQDELLSTPDFTSISGWALAPGTQYYADTGILLTSVASSATQIVAVFPRRRYKNTVLARCFKEKTFGRIQINWLDAKGKTVIADIKTFECTSAWAEHAMEVTAPPNAAQALVYVTGHTTIPLAFKSNSLRQ